MKTLYLVRHAKSSWTDSSLDDFDRPLNKRGKNDAPLMGKFLAEQKKAMPSLIITSPANRAFKTAKKIARKLKYPEKDIQKNPDIYEAGVADLLKVVQALDDKYDSVMITGHNPGMTSFVNFLCRAVNFDNMPTCSVCRVDFDVNSWGETDANKGKMIFFEYPRDYNP